MKGRIFSIKIKGASWRIRLLNNTAFKALPVEKTGGYYVAFCDEVERELVFNLVNLSRGVVMHEILHAFVAETNTESTVNITIVDMEEICCSIIQNHFMDMMKICDKIIYSAMKQLEFLK